MHVASLMKKNFLSFYSTQFSFDTYFVSNVWDQLLIGVSEYLMNQSYPLLRLHIFFSSIAQRFLTNFELLVCTPPLIHLL